MWVPASLLHYYIPCRLDIITMYNVCIYGTGIPSTCIVQQQSDYIGMALILCARVTRVSTATILINNNIIKKNHY